jgi:hypothetical protein
VHLARVACDNPAEGALVGAAGRDWLWKVTRALSIQIPEAVVDEARECHVNHSLVADLYIEGHVAAGLGDRINSGCLGH